MGYIFMFQYFHKSLFKDILNQHSPPATNAEVIPMSENSPAILVFF